MKSVSTFSYREDAAQRDAALGVTIFVYSAPDVPDISVGVPLPRGDQTADEVARAFAPLAHWSAILNPIAAPAAPMAGTVDLTVAPAQTGNVPAAQQPKTTGTTTL